MHTKIRSGENLLTKKDEKSKMKIENINKINTDGEVFYVI